MVQVKKKVWAPISSAVYASKNDSCFIAILPSRYVFFLILFFLKFRTLQPLRMSIVVLITDKPFEDLGKCELFWLYPSEYINLFSVNLFLVSFINRRIILKITLICATLKWKVNICYKRLCLRRQLALYIFWYICVANKIAHCKIIQNYSYFK